MAVAYRAGGEAQYALLHCRAHCQFDMDRGRAALGADGAVDRIDTETLDRVFGAAYGTVNPFTDDPLVRQVFDPEVFRHYGQPQTMMTNAGHHEYGVEFDQRGLVGVLTAAGTGRVEPLCAPTPFSGPASFGIITGNGPESGMALWAALNDIVRQRLEAEGSMRGDLSYPRVVVHSIPAMGLSMELESRAEAVWSAIESAVESLLRSEVTHVVLACNTTQYFRSRIERQLDGRARFVSLADVATAYIEREGVTDITIIGIPTVASLGEWSAFAPLRALGARARRRAGLGTVP